MLRQLAQRAPLQSVRIPEWDRRNVTVQLWRLDLIAAAAPGNKIFKLDENLRAAHAAGYSRVLSFGGAFSNHIHALALTGAARGFATVGVIRGDPDSLDNPTLRDAAAAGMQLHVVDRASYRALSAASHVDQLPPALRQQCGDCYVVPAGGANRLGALGCKVLGEVVGERAAGAEHVVLPCATGTTLAGLVAGLDGAKPVLGIAVLKGADWLADSVRGTLGELGAAHCTRWSIDTDRHGGGYARTSTELEQFVGYFQQCSGVPVEPVYSGKMLYAIHRRIDGGNYARGSRLLALHTGGLQGARGFGYRKAQQTDTSGPALGAARAT